MAMDPILVEQYLKKTNPPSFSRSMASLNHTAKETVQKNACYAK